MDDVEQVLSIVLDALVDPIVVLAAVRDDAGTIVDFRYAEVNAAACDYNQRTREEHLQSSVLGLWPTHAVTNLFEMCTRVIETGEPLLLDDYPHLSEVLGEERRYDIRAVRVDDSLVYTWRDVTDRLERDRARATVLSMEALADERDRVARDLHDGVIQEVYGTAMTLRVIADSAPEPTRARLEPVIDAQDEIIRHLRATVLGLKRPDLEETTVTTLVARTVAEAERSLGFAPVLQLEGTLDALDDHLLIEHLLLTLREMLSNVARHAHADEVQVAVSASPSTVEVSVIDNGVGPDAATQKGYGLTNLAKRATLLGGAFALTGRPTGGACARWRVPRSPIGHLVAAC